MTSKSSGFSLVELLVVVAIVGIIASVGIVSYNGYVSGTKKTSTKNAMQQISLGQSDYLSSYGEYYDSGCQPNWTKEAPGQGASSDLVESALFSGGDIITKEAGWDVCVEASAGGYIIKATNGSEKLTLDQNGTWGEDY